MNKVHIPSDGLNQQSVPSDTIYSEGHSITSVAFLPQMHELNLTEEVLDPNEGHFHQCLFKNCTFFKMPSALKKCQRLDIFFLKTEEILQFKRVKIYDN